MGELTEMRNRLKRGRQIRIWFWDGVREYKGKATRLDGSSLDAFLKVADFGEQTLLPGISVLDRLSKFFKDKTIDMKITGLGTEVNVRAKVTQIGSSKDNKRRIDLVAEFVSPKDRDKDVLLKMGQTIND